MLYHVSMLICYMFYNIKIKLMIKLLMLGLLILLLGLQVGF